MAVFLVDYENVVSYGGLKGIRFLNEQDKIVIFFSEVCPNIRKDELDPIINSGCGFKTYKLVKTGKNGLDFYISVETGAQIEQGEKQIAIISNDKGFQAVVDYVQLKYEEKDVCICRAQNIEIAITSLNDPEDTDRRSLVKDGMSKINLENAYREYEEEQKLEESIRSSFYGTAYEGKIPEILQNLSGHGSKTRKEIYTGFLHTFGRVGGTEIYRTAKSIL